MNLHPGQSLLILAAAVALATCGSAAASNASATKPAAAAPTEGALLAMEKQAAQAYARGDGKFFAHILDDQLVMQHGGSRIGKVDAIRMISSAKCEVRKGWAFTQPGLLKIDADVYVLGYVSDMQGTCTEDGKTEQIPSPVRAASVWVRHGKTWRVAFHGENLIVGSAAPPATGKAPRMDDKAAANVNTVAALTPVEPTADPLTNTLMKAENSVWTAWMHKDARELEGLTARNIAFVDLFGTFSPDKASTLKAWTSTLCDVSSVSLTNGVGTLVSPKVAILTLTGTVNGICGGQVISGQKIYGNSVYVKDGNHWKWVFGFNSPT